MQNFKHWMRSWLGIDVLELKQQAHQRALIEVMTSETLKREEATRLARSSTPADTSSSDEEMEKGDMSAKATTSYPPHLGRF